MSGVEFSPYERRALGLPQSGTFTDKESEILRKIIDVYPWIVGVADCNYDAKVCVVSVQLHAAQVNYRNAVEEYRNKAMEKPLAEAAPK